MGARSAFWLSCLVVWVGAEGSAFAEGKLARARREASSSSSADSDSDSDSDSHSRNSKRRGHRHSHDDDLADSIIEGLVCGMFGGCRDSSTVGTGYEPADEPPIGYAGYPYESPIAPYLLDTQVLVASTSPELDAQLRREHVRARLFAGHVMLDTGYLAGIAHGSLDARLLTPSPFELGVRTSLLWEPAARDYSLLGAGELGLRFVEFRAMTVRAFAGPLLFGRAEALQVGIELGLGVDIFLGRPWMLSGRVAGGILGQTMVPQARLQLGYLFERTEVFAGYEYLRIGSVDLSAPVVGLRTWL